MNNINIYKDKLTVINLDKTIQDLKKRINHTERNILEDVRDELLKCEGHTLDKALKHVNNLYKFSKCIDNYERWKYWLNKAENKETYLYVKSIKDKRIDKEYFRFMYQIVKGELYQNICIIKC